MTNSFEPYYAVIFTSKQTDTLKGYSRMADYMEKLAKEQSGFLGIESAKSDIGITVSYWSSLDAVKQWKQHSEHLLAQQQGKTTWYSWYHVRICKVEREYEFKN